MNRLKITVDDRDRRPIYVQIVEGVKELIARGDLGEGAALPPVRQLAADLGVNMNTVAGAYRELQKMGLLDVRHGSGAVVASRQGVASTRAKGDLRKTLRIALAGMVLAGMGRAEIEGLVDSELRELAMSKD